MMKPTSAVKKQVSFPCKVEGELRNPGTWPQRQKVLCVIFLDSHLDIKHDPASSAWGARPAYDQSLLGALGDAVAGIITKKKPF